MSPAPVYDDEKANAQGHHDDLGVHPERAEAEAQDLEDAFNMDDADDPQAQHQPNAADLARREAEGYGPGDGSLPQRGGTLPQRKEKEALDNKTGGFYRDEGGAGNTADSVNNLYDKSDDKKKNGKLGSVLFGAGGALKEKANNLSSKKKALLFGVGLGGSGLFVFVAVLVVLFATLKIPNLSEHIASWQFARTTRAFRQSVTQVNAEKIAVDSADDATFATLKSQYEGFRSATWGKLDKWRPTLTYKNMNATGSIDFQYKDPAFPGARQRLDKIVLDGHTILPEDQSLGRRVFNKVNPLTSKEDKILGGKVSATLEHALDDHHGLIRSSVNKKILADAGVELHWWDKLGGAYRGAKAAQADHIELVESVKRLEAQNTERSLAAGLQEGIEKGKTAQKNCIKDPVCAEQFFKEPATNSISEEQRLRLTGEWANNSLSDEARAALIGAADDKAVVNFAKGLSVTAAVAIPLCIIYDGSIERSGGTVDAASTSAVRTFYGIASAADQQKAGATSSEAVGATNRKLGNISASVPEKRARNQNLPVSTDTLTSPQASAAGTFSLIGAMFGNNIGSKIDPIADKGCPAITSWQGAATVATVEVALSLFVGGPESDAIISGGVKATTDRIITKISENLLTKQGLTDILKGTPEFVAKQGRDVALLAGATVLAKMIVLQRMNVQNSGVAREEVYANVADAGGNLAGNELCRQMMYGRPMTQPEVAESENANRQYLAEKKGQEGVFQRYFALSNPDSLLVNMGVSLSTQLSDKESAAKLVASTANRFGSSITESGVLGSINPFKKQVAHAMEDNSKSKDTNYQNVQWCWTEDELNLIENDPNYFPLQNDVMLEKSGRKGDIEAKYGECYTETMGNLLKEGKIQRDEDGKIYESAGLCSPKNLSRNNPEGFSDLVFRWRLSKRNDNTLGQLISLQAPQDSDTTQGGSGSGETGILAPGALAWPTKVQGSMVTSCYGLRVDPVKGGSSNHPGVDIAIGADTPAFAAADGEVTFAGFAEGYGPNFVIIKHGPGLYTSYGHMNSKTVAKGDKVTQAQQIGTVGSQGYSTGAHMHFNLTTGTDNFGSTFNGNVNPFANGLSIPPGVPNNAHCATS